MGKQGKERARQRRQQRRDEIFELRKRPYDLGESRWWSGDTVAVVTGANRGIGFEIARQIAGHGLRVVLTARDAEMGRVAASTLLDDGLAVEYHQLDVTDPVSVETFTRWVAAQLGGIDILVNNAGVNFNTGPDNSVQFAEKVLETNYFGTKRMIQAMIPFMRPSPYGARILNVSSRLGRANGRRNKIGDATLREQLSVDESLTEDMVDGMVAKFLEQVKLGSWPSKDWPQIYTDYSVSKLAVNAYTRLMARRLSGRPMDQMIYINCFCPGWVQTAMTSWLGNISAAEGADTGVWLALLPLEQSVSGKFFAERQEICF